MDTHSSHIPAGQDVFDNNTDRLEAFLRYAVNGSPELDALTEQTFDNPEQATQALKRYVMNIWNNPERMDRLWFTAPYEQIRQIDKAQAMEVIDSIANTLAILYKPLLVKDDEKKLRYVVNKDTISAVVARIDRESKNLQEGAPLFPGEKNTQADLAYQQLVNFLQQSSTRLRALIKTAKFPASVRDRSFKDPALYIKAKTFFATTSWIMMVYGHHGVYRNKLETLAVNEHNAGVDLMWTGYQKWIFETLNQDHQLLATLPLSVISASAVSLAAVKSVWYIRKLFIEDAEAARKGEVLKRRVPTSVQAVAVSAGILTGLVGPLALEMGGLLEKWVIGYDVSWSAHKTQAHVAEILNMENTSSPAGKAKYQYDALTNTVTIVADQLPEEELTTKQSGGAGPSYTVKMYPKQWVAVMNDLKFPFATPVEQNAVKAAESELTAIGPVGKDGVNFHVKNPTLVSNAQKLESNFVSDTAELLDRSNKLFGDIYQKRGDAEVQELLDARIQFMKDVEKYLAGIDTSNKRWGQRAAVYQKLINTLLAESNRKYSRNTKFDVEIQVDPPSLAELESDMKAPLPEYKWKSVTELLGILDGLVTEWAMTAAEKTVVISKVIARVGILEIPLFLLLTLWVKRAKDYYRTEINALGTQREHLDRLTDSLIDSVQQTFSGKGWEILFWEGSHGISREQAKYIVEELLVAYDAELEKYIQLENPKTQNFSTFKKTGRLVKKRVTPFVKSVFMGDTRVLEERRVAALWRAFEAMSKKAEGEHTGVAIPQEAIARIINHIVPQEKKMSSSWDSTKDINTAYVRTVGQMAEKLWVLHELTYATEAENIQRKQTEYEKRLAEFQANIGIFNGYIGSIDAVLLSMEDKFVTLHDDSIGLKDSIQSWVAQVAACQASATNDQELRSIESRSEEIKSSWKELKEKIANH